MPIENEMHPLTAHLKTSRGMTTRGWAEFSGFNPNVAALVIYNGYYHEEIIKKLKEEGLYDFLYEDIRAKIEETEKAKGGTNGNS